MKIRVTLTAKELTLIKNPPKTYENRDGSYRIYFNSLDEFCEAMDVIQNNS